MSTIIISAISGALVMVVALFLFRTRSGQDINTVGDIPPPPQITAPAPMTPITAAGASTADEVERLWKLHQDGALPDTEVAEAKARVLAGEPPAGAGRQVVLTDGGDNKIAAIKALREIRRDLGLKEAKDAVEGTPYLVASGIAADQAEAIAGFLRHAGATVELR